MVEMRFFNRRPAAGRPRILPSVVAIAAASLVIAACGSASSGGSGNGSQSSSNHSSQSASQSPAGNSAAALATGKVAGYGTVLTTGKGAPVYLLTADPRGGSSCSGGCARQWTPVTVRGKPTAGAGVNASLLSSFKRRDGSDQVLYNGHALYTHPGGVSAAAVAGTVADGGIWYLVSPSGEPIKKTTGSGY